MKTSAVRCLGMCAALLAGALLAAGTAGATTYSWSVPLSGQDIIASGLPAIATATGSASITANDATNQVCGTFSWSGVASPVVFGHIHQGYYGVPENPAFTVNLFGPDYPNGAPNPVTGCTIVPGPVISAMATVARYFNVVVHNQQFPGGAIRGQLGSSTFSTCQVDPGVCMGG